MQKGKKAGEKSNVRVCARCRPVNQKELDNGGRTVVKFFPRDPGAIELCLDDMPQTFNFDRMFGPESTQSEVFDVVQPLIADVLEGYNATVFAYGQTGTGKTYTMEGRIDVEGEEGIIPRSVAALFDGVAQADDHIEFTFKVSYVEIYMEKIRDLLDHNRLKTNLVVREDKINGIYIAGVTEEYVTSFDELLEVMQSGAYNRATAATGMNEGSSRSHSVFTITISQKDLRNAVSKSGKLVLVDLAGSEMVRKTGASGQQLEEAKTINKSLSALGQVINALTDDKHQHIPYRDSKLTRVLQDSLGGNSKTVLIIAISPSSYNVNETLSTIRFGLRAKAIENKVTVNATRSADELEALLERAEKAIDTQAAHIVTLTAKLQEFASGDMSFESASSTEEGTPVTSPLKKTPALEQVALIENLQSEVDRLNGELEDASAESRTRDNEMKEMGLLLKEKERLLFEAGDLLQEARKHYESQRERCEVLIREKAETSAQLDGVKDSMNGELEQLRFQLKEAQVSADTLKAENLHLVAEVAEITGDSVQSKVSSSTNSAALVGRDRHSSNAPAPPSRRPANMLASPVKTVVERELQTESMISGFTELCHSRGIEDSTLTALVRYVREQYASNENEVVLHETKAAALEQAQAETSKRVKELENQRMRLEADLQSRTETAVRSKLELEALTSQTLQNLSEDKKASGDTEKATIIAMHEKERTQNKSLQQRLEQLVAVHRQLLRKFASLELETSEVQKKLYLRDERIRQLESHTRGTSSKIRAQSERHIAELTNLREQIRLMKEEHLQRKDQHQHYIDLQLLAGRENANAPRSMRGGHSAAAENTATIKRPKSINGGKSVIGGSPVKVSGADRPVSTSFSSMMARLGVMKCCQCTSEFDELMVQPRSRRSRFCIRFFPFLS